MENFFDNMLAYSEGDLGIFEQALLEDEMDEVMVAEEGSTNEALRAIKSTKFTSALEQMRRGTSLFKKAKYEEAMECYKEAKDKLEEVREKIAYTRTWPLSSMLAWSIFGTAYSWGAESDAIDEEILGYEKANALRSKQNAVAISKIIGTFTGIDFSDILQIVNFFQNKNNVPDQPAKFWNPIASRLLGIVDEYIKACDRGMSNIKIEMD